MVAGTNVHEISNFDATMLTGRRSHHSMAESLPSIVPKGERTKKTRKLDTDLFACVQ